MPLVSVIVPFYNVGSLLEECLESVAAQTLTDFECILVDDGSTDASAQIAQAWTERDERFSLLHQANRGPGPARNLGIAHATGTYLMFVDGDDLLAPRALEQLHASLEESGSDFAGAQVWRLPLTRPVERSWAHLEPFGERRQRTTIAEIPLLMRDRMVWNKMWRRSFWDAGGYVWPDMLFEDFPVIMAAHLDATAVDTLPDPVYVWRERPKGESISVRGSMLSNVQDRVIAAGMVLDLVDAKATPEVRELVHSHLVDVDLREVMGSMITGHADDQPAIEALAHELGQRIDPANVGLAQPDLQRAYRAARENDMARLRALAQARAQGPTAATTSQRLMATPHTVVRKGRALGRKLSPHRVRTGRLVDYRLDDAQLVYRVEIPLDARVKRHASVEATLGETPMRVDYVVTPSGLLCDFTLDAHKAASHGGFQALTVEVSALGLRFRGHVTATPGQLHGLHRAGYWVQAVIRGGRFGVERTRRVSLIDDVHFEGHELVLHLSVADGTLIVEQPYPSQGVEVPVVNHEARLVLRDIVASDPADNPVTRIASRRLQLRTETGQENLRLVGPGLRHQVADRDVEITRAEDGTAFLVHRPR